MPSRMPLIALVLALGALIANVQVVARGETWSDLAYHADVVPPRLAAARAVHAATLPAWWDGTGLGVPLVGEPSHGAMAPMAWIATSPRLADLLLVLQLWWLALGVALWARRTNEDDATSVVAGLLVITGGAVMATALRGALPALCWLPWVMATRRPWVTALAIGMVGLGGQLALLVDAIAIALIFDRTLWKACIAGALIAMPQWLPAVFALPDATGVDVHAMPLARLVELVIPGSFGSVDPARGVVGIAGAHAWAPSIYVGAPLLALARPKQIYVVVALAILALMRGAWPAWLGAPELHVAVLAIVLASSLTVDRRRIAIAGAVTLVGAIALAAYRAGHDDDALPRALLDGGLAVACCVGAWFAAPRLAPLALALLVAPGFGARGQIASTDAVAPDPRWAELAQDEPPPRRLYRPAQVYDEGETPGARHFVPVDDALATLAGASGDRFGIAAARSDDPARPRMHDATWAAARNGGGVLLDRFGIGLAVLPTATTSAMTVFAQRGRWSLAQFPAAAPATVVTGVRFAADPERALALMFASDGRAGMPRGTIVLAGAGDSHDSATAPRPCAIERWEPGAIDLSCTGPGYAVISSTPANGWSVDGTWQQADVLRRATYLDAGTHVVHWRYRAPGMTLGLILAALGILALPLLRRPRT